MKKNKSVIVLISVILILAIIGGVFTYLYFATDTFRSDKELFARYFGQNEEIFKRLTNLKTIETLGNLKNENKYEINTNIETSYSEGGEVSNVLNNFAIKLDIQRDNEEQYAYLKGQLLYENDEYIQAELIKEKNIYGVRFPDIFQQFVTVKIDEKFSNIMNDFGITDEQTEGLLELFDDEINKENKEKIKSLKDKYINIIKSSIANGEFSKQKNMNITYNNNDINVNAYTVLLSGQQVQNILIEILNNIKNEEILLQNLDTKYDFSNNIDEIIKYIIEEIEIPTIKVTIYEYKQNTIKTVLGIGKHNITIENIEQNQQLTIKMVYSNVSDETAPQIEIDISKTSNEDEEKIDLKANLPINGENTLVTFSNIVELYPQTQINTEIGCQQGITVVKMMIKNDINIDQNVKRSEILGEQNSKLINSIKSENRKDVINKLQKLIAEKMTEKINALTKKIENNNIENENSNSEVAQVEVNKFNAKFEFYTGEEVSAENVKMLLDVVKDNIKSYEFLDEENLKGTNSNSTEKNKVNIKLNIEKDKKDENCVEKIFEKINSNKKYKVSIKYNDTNGLIDYITISEM